MASFVSYCVCMKWFCCCEFLDEVSKSMSIGIQNRKCSILYIESPKLHASVRLKICKI